MKRITNIVFVALSASVVSCGEKEVSKETESSSLVSTESKKSHIEMVMDSLNVDFVVMDKASVNFEDLRRSFGYGNFNLHFEFAGELSMPIEKINEFRDSLIFTRQKWNEWDSLSVDKNINDVTKIISYTQDYITLSNDENPEGIDTKLFFKYFSKDEEDNMKSFVSMEIPEAYEAVMFYTRSDLDSLINALQQDEIIKSIEYKHSQEGAAKELN